MLDVPSHEVLGAVNLNEGVAGPHSPSTSGARRHVWGSPTVARSFISAAAMPFFRVRQSRRLLAAADDHCDIASFGHDFFNLLQFLFFHEVLHFHLSTFRTHAALMAILAFRYLACTSLFVHGHHVFRERERDLIALPFLAWFPCFSK